MLLNRTSAVMLLNRTGESLVLYKSFQYSLMLLLKTFVRFNSASKFSDSELGKRRGREREILSFIIPYKTRHVFRVGCCHHLQGENLK
jgi:hypothetical protein